MGCAIVWVGLFAPRFVMIMLWIFTSYLGRAYEANIVPIIGFFVAPTTTLAWAVAQNQAHGSTAWGILAVILGVAADIGIWGNGRGVFNR